MFFILRRCSDGTWILIERVSTDGAPTGGSWTKHSRYRSRAVLVEKYLPRILDLYL